MRTGKIQISLEEAYNGCSKNITVTDKVACHKCKGSGFEFSDKYCQQCGGSGQIRTAHGVMFVSKSCHHCRGFGREVKDSCKECQGSGKIANAQNLEITVPAGIGHGQKVCPTDDLEIIILYAPHSEFTLMENMTDILSKTKISMFDAILGGSVKVNTLQGQKSLKISPGTQPNTILRIKNAGMRNFNHESGDHLVEVFVELPKSLTSEQEELLLKFKKTIEYNGDGND